jgi:anti-sigma B factor antagonist
MAVLDIERQCLDDSTVVLSVKGYLDAFSVTEFRQVAAELRSVPKVIINLATTFLDSAGLNALVGAVRQVREHRGEAAIVSSHPSTTRVLFSSGIDRVVALHPTLDEARSALNGPNDRAHPERQNLSIVAPAA